MQGQTYIYKNWTELFDRVKTTCGNERGYFACASFKGDDKRFMLACVAD
jgi:hypothetical protein